ncbi:MAG: hypothetical protein OHK0052_22570 [Anaerolineales bacterium]
MPDILSVGSKTPIAPEALVPRLGEYLIERGVLRVEQLQQALAYQQEKSAQGETRLMGQALLDLGFVDRETLDQVVTEQILQLQNALRLANQQLEQRVRERTAELESALRRLGELNQLKSNFISNVSHELRTPLTHIKGYIELLNDGTLGALDEQQAEAVSVIVRATHRLERLIEDLLEFSLAVRAELSLRKSAFSLREVLDEVLERNEPRAQSKRLLLRGQIPDEALMVEADREKLDWAINQLVENAVKFTHVGEVSLTAERLAGVVQVRVVDTGIGIERSRLPELFQPFHQLDGSNTRRYGGTGLGLALANRIIQGHGSNLLAYSELGKGSRFEFSLPLLADAVLAEA